MKEGEINVPDDIVGVNDDPGNPNPVLSGWDIIIDLIVKSGKRTLAQFLSMTSTPDVTELEQKSGMSAGEIMARANSRG